MEKNSSIKQLIKILIGAAWIDGKIQPEEREYLHRVAKEKGVAEDPEIQPLLYELRSVQAEEFYGWVEEYLGDRASSEDYQSLIESISALIYSDGDVATEEAKMLNRLQNLDPATNHKSSFLSAVQNLYRRWIDQQN